MIESIAITKTIDNLVKPIVGVGIVAGVGVISYSIYKGTKEFFNWGTDAIDDLTGYFTLRDAEAEVAKYEGLSKEEVSKKYSKEELEESAKQIRNSKSKSANSPAGKLGRFMRNLF